MRRVILIIMLLFVSGCSNNSANDDQQKPLFVIQVQPVAAFSAVGWFRKVGVVTAAEEVTVSSLVAGRVTNIVKKIGSKVWPDQLVIALQDIGWNTTFGAKRAAANLASAKNNYLQQLLALEKSLFDANIGFSRNQITSESSREDIVKQQERLAKDLRDNDLNISGSNLDLQFNKLQSDLEKAQLDYQTKLDADNQTILNFINSVKLISSDLGALFNDAIQESDDLLGVTPQNEHNNDAFEAILGNKDFYAKAKADKALTEAIAFHDEFKTIIGADINANTMSGLLVSYQKGVVAISNLLFAVETLLNKTEPGWVFDDATYSASKAKFDALQTKSSSISTSITNQLNNIGSFFATYKQSQESLSRSVDSLKQQVELGQKQLADTEYNTQIATDRSKLSLDASSKTIDLTDQSSQYSLEYAQKNNNLALWVLQSTLDQAQIAYDEANFNYVKLDARSPIVGTVTDILVDKGEEVSPGTPLFTIVNPNLLQVELDITAWEKELVVPWQAVRVSQGGVFGKGIVESVSDVADRNFGYKVIVVLTDIGFDIGSSIEVDFAGSVGDNIVIPLNAVSIVDNGRGVVQLWRQWKIIPQSVSLGAMAWEYVIVTEWLVSDDLVILNDTTNFDVETMQIKVSS